MKKSGEGDSADVEVLPTRPFSRPSTASIDTPVPRHYPLDLPGAPFHRYEHRLTVRDIMVHRIMTDYMNPTRVKPSTYDSFVGYAAAFDPIFFQDKELGADLRCLQKMLFTSYADLPPPRASPMAAFVPHPHANRYGKRHTSAQIEGRRNRRRLLCDQVLDLVRQHYFEADNAMLRAWISHLGAVPTPSFGLQTHTEPRSWAYNLTFPRDSDVPVIWYRAHVGRFHPRSYGHWTQKDKSHLKNSLQPKLAMQAELPLYDGGVFMPHLRRTLEKAIGTGTRRGPRDNRWLGNFEQWEFGITVSFPEERGSMRFIMQPCWDDRRSTDMTRLGCSKRLDLNLNPGRGRNRDGIWSTGQYRVSEEEGTDQGRQGRLRRRCTSLPPPGSFTTTYIGEHNPVPSQARIQVTFPRMTLAQLDRRSRRRSLSRTRIEEMFDWDTDILGVGVIPNTSNSPSQPCCQNCASSGHSASECKSPCGHCGAPNPSSSTRPPVDLPPPMPSLSDADGDALQDAGYEARPGRHQRPHLAPDCPVARHNRCKCVPFPTFHVAKRCGVPCRRKCGAEARPGTFRHPNAMLCRSRCCMCGIHGHSGKECRLRQCRCGQAHLGQDCGWNPTCRVEGCPRFWCGIHCRECGSTEKPFVEWRCAKCSPGPAPAVSATEETRGRGRRQKRSTGRASDSGDNKGSEKGTGQACGETAGPQRLATALPTHSEQPAPTIFGGPRLPKEGSGRDK